MGYPKSWDIVKMPTKLEQTFYDSNSEYVMGVDSFDKNVTAACVMKKVDGGVVEVVYIGRGAKVDMEEEIKMIASYFHIPESNILTEQP